MNTETVTVSLGDSRYCMVNFVFSPQVGCCGVLNLYAFGVRVYRMEGDRQVFCSEDLPVKERKYVYGVIEGRIKELLYNEHEYYRFLVVSYDSHPKKSERLGASYWTANRMQANGVSLYGFCEYAGYEKGPLFKNSNTGNMVQQFSKVYEND